MIRTYYLDEPGNLEFLMHDLLDQQPIHTGQWQSMDVSSSKHHATHEMTDVSVCIKQIPRNQSLLHQLTHPDLPWAEEHFSERVSGIPHNPPPSHEVWPYAVRGNDDHLIAGLMFDHTYPERFWPRHAGGCHDSYAFAPDGSVQAVDRHGQGDVTQVCSGRHGIRFDYGDLSDVVNLLVRSPLTRQAYLPVWFPEDTGASAHKGHYDSHRDGDPSPIRVPCTLGYHFMIRDGSLSTRYYIRSCDAYRHMLNDIYMACRLTQWMVDQVLTGRGHNKECLHYDELIPGSLIMHISSLHVMVGDAVKLKERTFNVPS